MGNGTEPRIYTVTELTRTLKAAIEGSEAFSRIWVKGEIYNLTLHSSGHIYFSLKDDNAVISAVFFRSYNAKLSFKLEEGMSVLAFGSLTVFERRGSYQISVIQLRPEGIGELQKRIEQLKKKLQLEGIFDPSRKKPLPFLPRRIGVVTSPTGAAVKDIIKVAVRRYPTIEIVIAPVLVQGEGAVDSIVRGIRELNRPKWRVDVIIAGRGGGSFEDLMAFNEEPVVRAFAESRVPIISAVGHQIDHPLCDDAADLAAPTPSAAAEHAVPVRKDLLDEVGYMKVRLNNSLASCMREYEMRLDTVTGRPVFMNPMVMVTERSGMVSDLGKRLASSMRQKVHEGRTRFLSVPPISMLATAVLSGKAHRFNMALSALEKISPVAVMKRGYAIPLDDRGGIIRSVMKVKKDDVIGVRLHDGTLGCTVHSVITGGDLGKEETGEN